MSPHLTHVVMTRVNLSHGFGDERATAPEWIDHRLDLLERTAWPSMHAQTVDDWHWLLLASADTPRAQRARLDGYTSSRVRVAYVSAYQRELFARLVLDSVSHDSGQLITSRLDADDIIARDFLGRVRAGAQGRRGSFFVNLDDGLRLDVSTGKVYSYRHRSNMFLSLVEDLGPSIETVLATEHHEAAHHHEVVHLEGGPAWMQVLHDANLSSRLGTHQRVRKASVLEGFAAPILATSPPDRPIDVAIDAVRFVLRRWQGRVGRTMTRHRTE